MHTDVLISQPLAAAQRVSLVWASEYSKRLGQPAGGASLMCDGMWWTGQQGTNPAQLQVTCVLTQRHLQLCANLRNAMAGGHPLDTATCIGLDVMGLVQDAPVPPCRSLVNVTHWACVHGVLCAAAVSRAMAAAAPPLTVLRPPHLVPARARSYKSPALQAPRHTGLPWPLAFQGGGASRRPSPTHCARATSCRPAPRPG